MARGEGNFCITPNSNQISPTRSGLQVQFQTALGTTAFASTPCGRARLGKAKRRDQRPKNKTRLEGRVRGSRRGRRSLLLPRALLVPVGLQALAALVLVHLEPAFLLEVAHGVRSSDRNRELALAEESGDGERLGGVSLGPGGGVAVNHA